VVSAAARVEASGMGLLDEVGCSMGVGLTQRRRRGGKLRRQLRRKLPSDPKSPTLSSSHCCHKNRSFGMLVFFTLTF